MRRKAGIVISFTLMAICGVAQIKPVDQVYPLLDAAHSRWFYFSSACLPFGMVNLFPDNNLTGEWDSGYRYKEDSIRSFTHIHEWQLAGVAVMPVVFNYTDLKTVLHNKGSHFSHETETVRVGYHRVHLDRYDIDAELTASNRAGFHRYRFPANGSQGVIFELGGRQGPSEMIRGGFKKINNHEIRGFVVNGPTIRRPKETPVYFDAMFDKPIKSILLYQNGLLTEAPDQWDGTNGKIVVVFATQNQQLLMKVGVSYTSEDGAAKNVSTEIPHWDFNKTEQQARDRWNEMLGRILVEGGTPQEQRRFYTDVWRAIQGRRIVSDADGRYADLTGKEKVIRQLPLDKNGVPEFNMYNSDAFWGAQWTLNTLWQLVYPEIAEEFCKSFLEYYKNGGLIPRGPSGGNDTFVMTGASSTPFFVSAWQKGIRGFDVQLAYDGLKKNHMPGGLMGKAGYEHKTAVAGGVEYYIKKGYVPYPLTTWRQYGHHEDGAGMTMEYAYQDWTLAQLALALGKNDDHEYFLRRSSNYKNLYNRATGFIQPKDSTGKWKEPFDPLLYDNGYVEGNAAQFTWFVPHDLSGLFSLMGGRDSAIVRLNRQFKWSAWHRFCNEHPARTPKFVDDRRTWLNYSNQPNMQAAYIFNHAGAPWLTQYWSREVVNHVFSGLSPYEGYNGEEDQGLIGALSALMKIGLFQMNGGCEENPYYEIGSPVFDAITIALNPRYYRGTSFRIETKNNSSINRYIQSAKLNDKKFTTFRIHHADIVGGGKLVLEMGDSPNKRWGIDEGDSSLSRRERNGKERTNK
jgi:predicted alpha-1,2-mannosidase